MLTRPLSILVTLFALAVTVSSVSAYDLSDTVAIDVTLAGGYQFQFLNREDNGEDEGGGAVALQPELHVRPTPRDTLALKLGFAADDGLNDHPPFTLTPWAADLEADVKHINGRDRDYVLTAWYKHVFVLGPEHTMSLTGGLIDATDYLDTNAFANDEYTQFMQTVFVNGPHAFLPSYDIGGALAWDVGRLGLRVVVMNVGENAAGNDFTFFGAQLAYTLRTPLGEGTYRLVLGSTTADFLTPDETDTASLGGVTLSFDQTFGALVGAFLRLGWQRDEATVDFEAVYSGGLQISGLLWGRPQDHLGLGYAYLDGGNADIDAAHVLEIYVRFRLHDAVALTVEVQYLEESLQSGAESQGWLPGLRLTAIL